MTTYSELIAQAEALMQQAEQARKAELATVIMDMKAKIKEYALTPEDLFAPSSKKTSKSRSDASAKYRGPNGELWAGGLGRKPQWVKDILAKGYNLDDYLI